MRHISIAALSGLLLTFSLYGCSSSHIDCPGPVPMCTNSCCESAGPASFDDACNPVCPAGTGILIDSCEPAPSCSLGDAGCGITDAAPIGVLCFQGPCCDRVEPISAGPCGGLICPSSATMNFCTPDPAARCTDPLRRCEEPSDCVLTSAQCCATCGGIGIDDLVAVRSDSVSDHATQVCPIGGPSCPPCVPTVIGAPFIATCGGAGLCEVVDTRAIDDLNTCTEDTDCRVRTADCCECGGSQEPGSLIAIRNDATNAYYALACDSGQGCPECAPAPPENVRAFCNSASRCELSFFLPEG